MRGSATIEDSGEPCCQLEIYVQCESCCKDARRRRLYPQGTSASRPGGETGLATRINVQLIHGIRSMRSYQGTGEALIKMPVAQVYAILADCQGEEVRA